MYTTQSNYAWIIDNDPEERTVPRIGPWNTPGYLITLLERSDTGLPFRITSGDQKYYGRVIGVFDKMQPLKDLNFVAESDIIEYKNSMGFWAPVVEQKG